MEILVTFPELAFLLQLSRFLSKLQLVCLINLQIWIKITAWFWQKKCHSINEAVWRLETGIEATPHSKSHWLQLNPLEKASWYLSQSPNVYLTYLFIHWSIVGSDDPDPFWAMHHWFHEFFLVCSTVPKLMRTLVVCIKLELICLELSITFTKLPRFFIFFCF